MRKMKMTVGDKGKRNNFMRKWKNNIKNSMSLFLNSLKMTGYLEFWEGVKI